MMRKFLAAAVAALLLFSSPALADTDCSGTASGTAQAVWSSGQTKWFVIMNNSANLMCISFTGTAAISGLNCASGSFPLNPGSATSAGGSFASLPQQTPQVLSIVASAGSSTYSCVRSN